MAETKKLLIGIPLWKPYHKFTESLPKFLKAIEGHYNYEVYTVRQKPLVVAQNEIADYFMRGDYSHLLILEDDHWGHTKEMLDSLFKPDVDVCGINYYIRWFPYQNCIMEEIYPDREDNKFGSIVRDSGYAECDLVGFAMMLIKRRVFNFIPQPYFTINKRNNKNNPATDEDFCKKCKDNGIKLYGCFDHVLPHRELTKENIEETRNKAIITLNQIIRDWRRVPKNEEITEDMLRDCPLPDIHDLDYKYRGKTCYIVGRGPSVQYLNKFHFPTDGPIVAIGDTYKRIEQFDIPNDIYSLQKDLGFGRPTRSTLLVHSWEESSLFEPYYRPRYVFDCEKFGMIRTMTFSAVCALKFAQVFGCSDIKMISFDSCTVGDYRTQEENETITIQCNKRSYHQQRVIQEAMIFRNNLKVEYITPGLQEGLVEDKRMLFDANTWK